ILASPSPYTTIESSRGLFPPPSIKMVKAGMPDAAPQPRILPASCLVQNYFTLPALPHPIAALTSSVMQLLLVPLAALARFVLPSCLSIPLPLSPLLVRPFRLADTTFLSSAASLAAPQEQPPH